MNHRLPGLCALAATALAGCPSVGMYVSPRTVAAGRIQHNAFVEFIPVPRTSMDATGSRTTAELLGVPALSYMGRLGLAARIDLGFRLSTLGATGLDLKFMLVRSRYFDLAVDPALVASWRYGQAQLPLVAGINLSPATQVVAGGRFTWWFPMLTNFGSPSPDVGITQGMPSVGGFAALRLVLGGRLAIQPEYGASVFVGEGSAAVLHSFGVGFTFGNLPDYGPDPGPTAPPAPPAFPPPPPL